MNEATFSNRWTSIAVGDEFVFHMPRPTDQLTLNAARLIYDLHTKYNCLFIVTGVNHDDISATLPLYHKSFEQLGIILEGFSSKRKLYHFTFSWAFHGQYMYVKQK